jgi:hypothetical protein
MSLNDESILIDPGQAGSLSYLGGERRDHFATA